MPNMPNNVVPIRADGWSNSLTGLGTSRDKRIQGTYIRDYIDAEMGLDLYRSDSLAKRIVRLPPDEMLREWWDLQISPKGDGEAKPVRTDSQAWQRRRARRMRYDKTFTGRQAPGTDGSNAVNPLADDSPLREVKSENISRQAKSAAEMEALMEQAEDVQDYLEDLKFPERVHEALYFSRAAGGGGIFMGVDDGRDPSKPLNASGIRSIRFFTSFHSKELQAVQWNENPLDPDFGQPSLYRIVPQTTSTNAAQETVVHASRIIAFQGDVVSRRQMRENYGWGDSVFVAMWEVLRDFNTSWGSTAHLIQDFSMGVYTFKGLGKIIQGDKTGLLQGRLAAIQMAQSTVRAALLDEGETYERKTTPMGGLPETLELFMLRMAAAAEMPVSLLFGREPAGLNATGDADIRFWYSTVAAKQKRFLRPQIEQVLKAVLNCRTGPTNGIEPEGWHVHFPPLWRMTEKEEAEIRKLQSDVDIAYIGQQVLIPEEVTQSRFGGKEYSTETKLDMNLREAIANEPPPEPPPPAFVDRNTGEPVPVDPISGKPSPKDAPAVKEK